MNYTVSLYSMDKCEIERFLNKFYETNISIDQNEWEKQYKNPIEMVDIIGVFIDNSDDFKINMWINIDEDFSINVTNGNVDKIIKYLYERFPY